MLFMDSFVVAAFCWLNQFSSVSSLPPALRGVVSQWSSWNGRFQSSCELIDTEAKDRSKRGADSDFQLFPVLA
jgi:hypothetical protein